MTCVCKAHSLSQSAAQCLETRGLAAGHSTLGLLGNVQGTEEHRVKAPAFLFQYLPFSNLAHAF